MLDGSDFQNRKAYYSCCAGEGFGESTKLDMQRGDGPDTGAPEDAAGRVLGWRRFRAAIRPSQRRPRRSGNHR
jgi:hypothetical protein